MTSTSLAAANVREMPAPVASVTDFPDTGLLGVAVDGVELVLVKHLDRIRAFEGRCPHQGTLLSEGELVGSADGQTGGTPQLICRSHQWRFDCLSGQRLDQQGTCLRSYPVTVADGLIYVEPLSLDATKHGDDSPGARKFLSSATIPGPKPVPFLGNVLQIDRRAFHQTLEKWAAEYGPLFCYRIGSRRMFATADAELANQALKARPEDFRRPEQLQKISIRGMNALGVFAAEGEHWRRQRPVVMQSLDNKHLRQFFPTLLTVTERLGRRWQRAAESAAGVDVQSDLMRYTVDVTTTLAFAQDTNTLETEGDVIQKHLDQIFPTMQRRLLSPFPYWRYVRLPADRQVEASVEYVYAAVKEFIRRGREQLVADPGKREHPENLLQSLLVAADEGEEGFSEADVADNVLTMLLAGEDTTANTLAWALYYLAQYPEIQQKMRDEVAGVTGGGDLESYEQTRQLRFIEAVVHETMRLKPVAPINGLQALRDVQLGEWTIRKGDSLTILARVMAMNNTDFPDAEAFKPERWITEPGEQRQVNPRSFMPFGSGPRLCPGRSLALLEIKTVLAMVVSKFQVTAAADLDSVTEQMQFTMSPVGLRIRFNALGL